MISQRARLLENNCLWLHIRMHVCFQRPSINLNPPFAAIVADIIGVLQNNELLGKSLPVNGGRRSTIVRLIVIIVFVPVKVHTSAVQSLKVISAIEESGLHVVRKHEYFT